MLKIISRYYDALRYRIENWSGVIKLVLTAFVWKVFCPNFGKKNHWIICEKRNEARDNGYHFFRYLRQYHPEIDVYYIITKDSSDLHKVENLGKIVYADSLKHCLLFLSAKASISSQPHGAYPYKFSFPYLKIINRFCRRDQKTVFLQHGIIHTELAHRVFDYDKCYIDYFVCSAKREYEFVKSKYFYPDRNIGCVGLCRFDYLLNAGTKKDNTILIMPTWRMWHKRKEDGVPLTANEIDAFKNGEFFCQYAALLNNEALLKTLRDNGMKVVFYVHYQLQDYTPLFKHLENDVVCIADRYRYDVQQLLMESRMLLTDYSSVFFDFAYMNKPLVYFQFDKNRFHDSHYAEGYFDYDRDGFGPCCTSLQEVVDSLVGAIKNNCVQPETYAKRVAEFFMSRDGKNCERTYQAIAALTEMVE